MSNLSRRFENTLCRIGFHQLRLYTYQGRLLDAFCFRSDYCRGKSHKSKFMGKNWPNLYTSEEP